jgi:hypothetical protein
MSLFAKKSLESLLAEADESGKGLKRTLSAGALVALGIGAIIGAGLFVRTAAAAAQNATASDKPVLLKVNFNGGHAGDMTDEQNAMKQQAAKYAFILWQCSFDKANKYD